MPATLEAAIVLGILAAPGFVAFYIAREVSPFPTAKLGDTELLLSSIAFAAIVLVLEAGMWVLTTAVHQPLQTLAGVSATELRMQGYADTLREHPTRVLMIAIAQYFVHGTAVVAVGLIDPIGRLVEWRRQRSGFSAADLWILGLGTARIERGKQAAFLRIVLDTGEAYYGFLSKMSNQPNEDGTKDLVLEAPSWASDRTSASHPISPDSPENSAVVLNTKNIRSVDALFQDLETAP